MSDHELREQVRVRYAAAATAVTRSGGQALAALDAPGTPPTPDLLTAFDVAAAAGAPGTLEALGTLEVLDAPGSCCGPTCGPTAGPAAGSRAEVAAANASCCGGGGEVDAAFGAGLYSAGERGGLPAEAVLASLGCGNPVAVAELHEGERVLDLGSGGGIDVLLSAKRVGPTGRAFGIDMTDEMLELARANAAKVGATNVEFRKGTIEAIPMPDASVDVVISNCVINLSVDKPAVLAEMFRVLRPGGRIGISDVVAEDHLAPQDRAERGSYVGCIAGALSLSEYRRGLAAAGFVGSDVTVTHEVADGMHSALIRAVKPG